MKILLISSYLPYPLYSGGQVRLYNLLKELSGHHQITLICEKRENQTDSDVKEVEKICTKVITVKRRKQWSLKNIIKTLFSPHSFLIIGHTHPQMRKLIKEELENSTYDLIHVETFYVAQNIPATPLPIVLAEHNIEYQVYSRYAKNAKFFLRPFLNLDVHKIKKEEQNFWKNASTIAAVSEEDKSVIQQINPNVTLVPNGVNTNEFSLKNIEKTLIQKEKKILYIGDFSWIQNRDSLSWIIKEIWPEIKPVIARRHDKAIPLSTASSVKLWIVGRHIPKSLKQLTDDPDVIFDEKSSANPASEIFKQAYILLAPIRVGGGTSYKILESMSVGTPVVITPLSADAIQAKDSEEVLVGEDALELAAKTLKILHDHALYKKVSHNARLLIEKNYTWKTISKKLSDIYTKYNSRT